MKKSRKHTNFQYSEPEFNYVLYLYSLRVDESQTHLMLYDSIIAQNNGAGRYESEKMEVKNPEEMRLQLGALYDKCKDDRSIKPMLFLDMHGSVDGGVRFNGTESVMLWKEFNDLCREINILTANNLIVILTLCYGIRTILEPGMHDPAPYNMIIGSPFKVYIYDEIKVNMESFLSSIFLNYKSIGESLGHFEGSTIICAVSELLIYNLLIGYEVNACDEENLEKRYWKNSKSWNRKSYRQLKTSYAKHVSVDTKKIIKYRNRYLAGNDERNANRYTVPPRYLLELISESRRIGKLCQFRPENDTARYSMDDEFSWKFLESKVW